MLKVWGRRSSANVQKVMWLVGELKLAHEHVPAGGPYGVVSEPKFRAMNPNGLVPVIEDDGLVMWESNAILQYLASKKPDSGVLPTDPRRRALVTQWQCWDLAHWDPACATLIFERMVKKLLGLGEPDPAEIKKGEDRFKSSATVLDAQLQGRKYITGDTLTVADFSVGASLNLAQPAQLPVDQYKEIVRWHAGLSELPAWRKTLQSSQPPSAG